MISVIVVVVVLFLPNYGARVRRCAAFKSCKRTILNKGAEMFI